MSEKFTPKEDIIYHLAAIGKSANEIAEITRNTPSRVQALIDDPRGAFEIKRIRFKLFGQNKNTFQNLIPAAEEAIAEILENPNSKPSLRFTAAQEVLDRTLGKPKQTMEIQGSLIRSVYDKLDQQYSSTPIDVSPNQNILANPLPEDETPKEPSDIIDDWANKFL